MMKKWGIALLLAGVFLGACKSDDDNRDLPQDEQNQIDDQAIVDYLEDHYFDPERGVIKKYDEEDEEDDTYPNLKSLGVKLPSGVWVVKRPGVEAEGTSVVSNTQDSILISYNSSRFKASYEDLNENQRAYNKFPAPFFNTIYSTGTAAWDPVFYHTKLTEEMITRNIDLSYFVIEGFVEGLKEFKSTQTNGSDLYNFQGAIIVPSRMAYGRDFVYLGGQLDPNSYRDNSFVFNFEVHKVIPRNTN